MKKLFTLFTVVVVAFCAMALPTFAADRGQYLITVKSPSLALGDNLDYSAKFAWFDMTQYSQKWFYLGNLHSGSFTGFGGMVSDWSEEACGFAGVKFAPAPFGSNGTWSVLTDNTAIFNDGETDLFSWSTVEYNFMVDERPIYFGPHAEVVKTGGITRAWGGVHVGTPDLLEIGVYYHEKDDWSLRGSLTILLDWPS